LDKVKQSKERNTPASRGEWGQSQVAGRPMASVQGNGRAVCAVEGGGVG
jgi:hypothetical protein